MTRYYFLFPILLSLYSCSDNSNNSTTTAPPPPTVESKAIPELKPLPYPSIPDELAQDLYNRCDFVDYIFYDPTLPMSISLNEVGSIRSTFSHFLRDPAMSNGTCKATGRVMFQHQGEYITEADFYITNSCTYFIFMVDQKPTYANAMSDEGIKFFRTNITQAKASVQQKIQEQQQQK